MMRLYSGCGTRRMTSTTMVLAILDSMTEPTFSFLLLWIVSAIGRYSPFLPVFAVLPGAALLGATFFAAAVFGEACFLPAAFTFCGATFGALLVTSGTGAAAAAEGATPFSFSTVKMRARSLRSVRTFLTP